MEVAVNLWFEMGRAETCASHLSPHVSPIFRYSFPGYQSSWARKRSISTDHWAPMVCFKVCCLYPPEGGPVFSEYRCSLMLRHGYISYNARWKCQTLERKFKTSFSGIGTCALRWREWFSSKLLLLSPLSYLVLRLAVVEKAIILYVIAAVRVYLIDIHGLKWKYRCL